MRKFMVLAPALLLVGALVGCGGSRRDSAPPPIQVTPSTIQSVAVSCSSPQSLVNMALSCSAQVVGTGSFNAAVTWTATNGSVSSSGAYTPSAAGNGTVTATSIQDTSKFSSTTIAVSVPATINIRVTDLPPGAIGNLSITDPKGSVSQSTGAQPIIGFQGMYTIAAAPVTVGKVTYYPLQASQSYTLSAGDVVSTSVEYKNAIASTTKAIETNYVSSVSVANDGTTISLPSASTIVQSLTSGDVLVVPPSDPSGSLPFGLLRKIISTTSSGSQIVATTADATLADAFQRLVFQINIPATALTAQTSLRRTSGNPTPRAEEGPCGPLSLGAIDISKQVGFVFIKGTYKICPGLTFMIDMVGTGYFGLVPQLNTLSTTVSVANYSSLSVNVGATGSLNDTFEFPLANESYGPAIVVPVPLLPFPIFLVPSMTPVFGLTGKGEAGLTWGRDSSDTASRTLSYANGAWNLSPISSSASTSYSLPGFTVSGEARAYLGIILKLYVEAVIVPSAKPSAYLKISADSQKNPRWTLSAGINAPLSINLSKIGFGKEPYEIGDLFDLNFPLASGPALYTVSPATVYAGSASAPLILTGDHFLSTASITSETMNFPATMNSETQLQATLPKTDLLKPRMVQIDVDNLGVGNPLDPFHIAETTQTVAFEILSTVTINPPSATLQPGKKQQFTATVQGGGTVDWSLVESSIGSVDSTGLFTAPSVAGTYHVVATNHDNDMDSAQAIVTVGSGIHRGQQTLPHANNTATLFNIAWNIPFSDSDYTAVCSTQMDETSAFFAQTATTPEIVSKATNGMTVSVTANSSSAFSVTLSCMGIGSDYQGALKHLHAVFPTSNSLKPSQTLNWNTPFSSDKYVAVCTALGSSGANDNEPIYVTSAAMTASSMDVAFNDSPDGGAGGAVDCIGAQSLNGEVSTGAVGISTDYSDFPPQGHEIGTLTWDKGFANTNYMTVCGAGSSVNNFSAELLAVVISQGASTALVGVRVDGPRNGVETISCFGLQ